MAVATRQVREVSPLPPGRYWLIVIGGANMRDFSQWTRDMSGAVVVESSSLDQDRSPPQLFVIFRVPPGRSPFLNAEQFGFPNEAPPEVTQLQDVEQEERISRPENTDFGLPIFAGGSAALLLLALLWIFSQQGHGSRRALFA